jgi:hypothetical protein
MHIIAVTDQSECHYHIYIVSMQRAQNPFEISILALQVVVILSLSTPRFARITVTGSANTSYFVLPSTNSGPFSMTTVGTMDYLWAGRQPRLNCA